MQVQVLFPALIVPTLKPGDRSPSFLATFFQHMHWRELSRQPSFGVAYAGSLASLLAVVLWAIFDNSFFALPGGSWRYWDELWPRYLLFIALSVVGIISTTIVFLRLLVGDRRGRSLLAMMLAMLLASAWLTLSISHEKLAWNGFVWHVRCMLPGLKEDAKVLRAAWPVQDGSLPYLGTYKVSNFGMRRNELFVARWAPGFMFNHTVHSIGSWDPDRIRFDLGKFAGWVEYCPNRTAVLRAREETPAHFQFIELEPEWFLVWSNANMLGPS